jgi:AraC family transcriptional regulator
MIWNELSWEIPLRTRPRVSMIAMGVHGHKQTERYFLPKFWCVHFYPYAGEVRVNGQPLPIQPGHVGVLPPGAKLEYLYHGRSIHSYAHFYFQPSSKGKVPIPAMQDLGDDFVQYRQEFDQAMGLFSTESLRTEIRVWEILWKLATRSPTTSKKSGGHHPAIQKSLQLIESRLGTKISVQSLAKEVDLSHNHLIRLFQKSLRSTIVSYIRERRVQRARHLLIHSTLPIKAIAHEVGIPDPHAFNKIIRHATGSPPRVLREKGI